jgi:transcriptional antiterminator NusG
MGVEYESSHEKTTIFAVKTTIGQEKAVLQSIFNKLRVLIPFPEVQSFMVTEQFRGYIFIEANHQTDVLQLIAGVKHVHGSVVGSIKLNDIAHIVIPKRAAELFSEGDYVEVSKGPFSGHKGYIEKMPSQKKEDIAVRITSAENAIVIRIHADYLKVLEKKLKEPIQKEFKFGDVPNLSVDDLRSDSEDRVDDALSFGQEEGAEEVGATSDGRSTHIDFGDEEDDEEDDDDAWDKFG